MSIYGISITKSSSSVVLLSGKSLKIYNICKWKLIIIVSVNYIFNLKMIRQKRRKPTADIYFLKADIYKHQNEITM